MNLELNFPPHNSADNQSIFDNNEKHFKGQCLVVLTALMRGERLTTSRALLSYGIGDLRARVRDLIHAGIKIEKQLMHGRYKSYSMGQDEIERVSAMVKNLST